MFYKTASQNHPNAMRLQNVGLVEGTPASEIKVGSFLMWNFGYKTEIKSIEKVTDKSITVTEESNGKLYKRTFRKTRLVCILQESIKPA